MKVKTLSSNIQCQYWQQGRSQGSLVLVLLSESQGGEIPRNEIVVCLDLATEQERQLKTAHVNQTTGLTNDRAANWALEIAFSPFRVLSCRQLTFPFFS